MEDVTISGAGGGHEGGGFGGGGGAAMRAKPSWMKGGSEQGIDVDHGDSDWEAVPPYTVEEVDGADNGPLLFAMLLLLVVGIYVAYR